MPLSFVLNIERKDILVQILPLWCTFDQLIGVLQNMSDAGIKVSHAVGVGVPGRYIVVAGFSRGAVEGGQRVFADVGVVAPAAELVAVVEGDCEFDVCGEDGASATKGMYWSVQVGKVKAYLARELRPSADRSLPVGCRRTRRLGWARCRACRTSLCF
jgi:hypothetical protein